MADNGESIELSIDTAGAFASVALTRSGNLLAELTWRTYNSHSVELLPTIDTLLRRTGVEREQIRLVFVNRGPGSYAGLRVGISTAMGLALALEADLLAVGRLEIDAYPNAPFPGPIAAIHQAGRGDLAWAVYAACPDWHEVQPPRLGSLAEFVSSLPSGALCCGELAGLEDSLRAASGDLHLAGDSGGLRRAGTLAAIGWQRYSAGARANPMSIEPLYLREAHITQPKQTPSRI